MTTLTRLFAALSFIALTSLAFAPQSQAASSMPYSNERITAYLITAEDGVAPGAGTLSAALRVDLAEGWKTYWKSPGSVGYPPEIDWTASQNVAGTEIFWPAPKRFEAFDIENYGYETSVTYPIMVSLSEAGNTTALTASVNLLVCHDICVPELFELSVDLPSGSAIDTSAATEIAAAIAQVPGTLEEAGLSDAAYWISEDQSELQVSIRSETPLTGEMSIFPDMGQDASFGKPDISLKNGGTEAILTMPILSAPERITPFEITLVTGDASAVFEATTPASAPFAQIVTQTSLVGILLIALLGGLILNVMPCVLPVLSIKLTSALKAQGTSPARIRAGFLASAAGVLAFMLALAAILIVVRLAGGQVGWGIQFQSPIFLALMLSIITAFAANMLGLFEITLPQGMMTRLADADGKPGLTGDFATGALAAILATPCSAPFLGTAVTFALAGSAFDTLAVFTALGLGLALPYILVALRPSLINALPKPGRWMLYVKWALGLLLAGTAVWLFMVLSGVAGTGPALASLAAIAVLLIFLGPARSIPISPMGMVVSFAVAILLPAIWQSDAPAAELPTGTWSNWQQTAVVGHVAEGKTVFVDVTADWCLTCKTNKALVLDRAPIADLLASEGVVAMRADWTRPDPEILSFLQSHDRFGIPFNIVYGPAAPEGIALPEILTTGAVQDAFDRARGVN